jgi:hypothetical protein
LFWIFSKSVALIPTISIWTLISEISSSTFHRTSVHLTWASVLAWTVSSHRWSDRRSFSLIDSLSGCDILNLLFVKEFVWHISSLNFFNFLRCILVDEFHNVHKSSTDSYKDVVTFFNFDKNTFLSKLIYSCWFS